MRIHVLVPIPEHYVSHEGVQAIGLTTLNYLHDTAGSVYLALIERVSPNWSQA